MLKITKIHCGGFWSLYAAGNLAGVALLFYFFKKEKKKP